MCYFDNLKYMVQMSSQIDKTKCISALLPIKNGSRYIEIISKIVTANMGALDEILVIDDGSYDSTYSELTKWANFDKRVRIIKNSGSGLVSALNLGIREASNEWIARFDVDDDYPNDRIQRQISCIEKNTIAVFSDYEFITSTRKSLGVIPSPINPLAVAISLMESRRTAHPSVIFNKQAVESVGGYREKDFPAEDLSLWLRLTRIGNLISTPDKLLRYQLHKNSISSQMAKNIYKIKQEMVSSIRLQDSVILQTIDSFEEILNSYDKYSYSSERKTLFTKEIFTTLSISKILGKKSFLKEVANSSFKLGDLANSRQIFKEALFRKIYRSLF
jgi:glycosyltransferase involved in cell wall biosynthesis